MARNSLQDLKRKRFWTALLAELIGTMLLVLVACGSTMSPTTNTVQISLSFAFSVASIVWAIGHVSGGHINPGVTIAFFITRKLSLVGFLLYIVAQTIGAVIGAALLLAFSPEGYKGNLGTPGLSPGISAVQGFFIEMALVFVLVFVVFAACDSQRSDLGGSVPLTVGIAIGMCHLWAVPFTGSGMNPARSFGSAVVSNSLTGDHWLYWIGPLLGGAAAGLLYDLIFAVNATPAKLKGFFSLDYDDSDYDKVGRRSRSNDSEMKA